MKLLNIEDAMTTEKVLNDLASKNAIRIKREASLKSTISNTREFRAKTAKEVFKILKDIPTTYDQENKKYPKDYNNFEISDCVKFIHWILMSTDEIDLLGLMNVAGMRKYITEIMERNIENQQVYRPMDEPKLGDLLFWQSHIAIVSSLDTDNGKFTILQMGESGPGEYTIDIEDPSDLQKYGRGNILGFWSFEDLPSSYYLKETDYIV